MDISLSSSLYPSLYFGESIVSDDSVTWDSNFPADLLADIILNLSPIELSFFFVGEMGEAEAVGVVVATTTDVVDDEDDAVDDDPFVAVAVAANTTDVVVDDVVVAACC
jgi:hypothetical protein